MTDCDEGGEYDGVQDEPRHVLLAREAEMLYTGGHGLEKDPQKSGRAGQTCSCGGRGLDRKGRNSCPTANYGKVQG